MSALIVVVDLGRLRAYRVAKDPLGGRKIELIMNQERPEAHEKISDIVTDTVGRFSRGEAAGGAAKGAGEDHKLASELEKRQIRSLSQDISALVEKEGNPRWSFAAPESIHGQIVDQLSQGARALMAGSIKANLAKATKEELLERF